MCFRYLLIWGLFFVVLLFGCLLVSYLIVSTLFSGVLDIVLCFGCFSSWVIFAYSMEYWWPLNYSCLHGMHGLGTFHPSIWGGNLSRCLILFRFRYTFVSKGLMTKFLFIWLTEKEVGAVDGRCRVWRSIYWSSYWLDYSDWFEVLWLTFTVDVSNWCELLRLIILCVPKLFVWDHIFCCLLCYIGKTS